VREAAAAAKVVIESAAFPARARARYAIARAIHRSIDRSLARRDRSGFVVQRLRDKKPREKRSLSFRPLKKPNDSWRIVGQVARTRANSRELVAFARSAKRHLK